MVLDIALQSILDKAIIKTHVDSSLTTDRIRWDFYWNTDVILKNGVWTWMEFVDWD